MNARLFDIPRRFLLRAAVPAALAVAIPSRAERLSLTDYPEASWPDLTSPSGGEIQDWGRYRRADGEWVCAAGTCVSGTWLNDDAQYGGSHAFDNVWDYANGRVISQTQQLWVSYEFPTATTVDAFRLRATGWQPENFAPTHFRFWGSSDGGSTWRLLDEETGQTNWSGWECRLYGFQNRNAYTTYKFEIVESAGGQRVQFHELELLNLGLAGSGSDPAVQSVSAIPAPNGASAVVSGLLASDGDGGGSAQVRLEWGSTGAYGNDAGPLTVADGDPFSFTITGLEGGETVHYRFVAENGSGDTGATADLTFTALGGSVLGSAVSATSSDKTVSVSGTFDVFGAGGETTLFLWASGNAQMSDAHVVDSVVVRDGGDWTIDHEFGFYSTYWFYVTSSNGTSHASWTSRTDSSSVTTYAAYRWKRTGVAAGDIAGSSNYEGTMDASAIGATSIVTFDGVETPEVRVRVSSWRGVGDLRLASDAGLTNLTFVGSSPDQFRFEPTVTVWPGAGRRVTFESITVNPARPAGASYLDLTGDVVLADRTTFAANYSVSEETVAGSSFTVGTGCTSSINWTYRFGLGSVLHVAGGTAIGRAVELARAGIASPGAVRLSGAAPSLAVGKFHATDAGAAAPAVFEIPAGGWSAAPVSQATAVSSGSLPASELGVFAATGSGTIVLAVDPASPALDHRQPACVVPLVRWPYGIDTSKVAFSDSCGRAVRFFFGYGDSPDDTAPASAGDLPVAVWAALQPVPPPTVIVVK